MVRRRRVCLKVVLWWAEVEGGRRREGGAGGREGVGGGESAGIAHNESYYNEL